MIMDDVGYNDISAFGGGIAGGRIKPEYRPICIRGLFSQIVMPEVLARRLAA